MWRNACPERIDSAALVKDASRAQPDREGRAAHRGERRRYIVRAVAIDLSNEAQRKMQLVIALPAGAPDASHVGKQGFSDGGRPAADGKGVVKGRGVSVRGNIGGRRCLK